MIVLDEPYVSEPLIAWLEESQHPVLDNAFARSIARFSITSTLICPA